MIVGLAFSTVRDLVVRHGHAYTSQPLPKGTGRAKPQACYANALHAALSGRRVYVEEFAIPPKGDLAVLRAWVTDSKNPMIAYDPTWKTDRDYFGIPFQLDYVLRMNKGRPTSAFWTFGSWAGRSCAARTGSRTLCGGMRRPVRSLPPRAVYDTPLRCARSWRVASPTRATSTATSRGSQPPRSSRRVPKDGTEILYERRPRQRAFVDKGLGVKQGEACHR